MSVHVNRVVPAAVLCVGLLSVACGGSGAVTGPDVAVRSASIEGTVVASSVSGLRVTVVGTVVTATTDAAGRFSLPDVPPGNPTVRFEAPGVDARLGLQVASGQTLAIRVAVSGNQATLLSSSSPGASPEPSPTPTPSASPTPTPSPTPGAEVELRGTIDAISGSDLTVSSRLVHTDGSTRIKQHGDSVPFSALQVGQTVEVEGNEQPDGSVLARKVSIEDEGNDGDGNDGDDQGGEVNFQGSIQSISGSDLTVDGRLVHTDGSTRIRQHGDTVPFSALQVGQRVEVEGSRQSDGSVLAKKISIEDGD